MTRHSPATLDSIERQLTAVPRGAREIWRAVGLGAPGTVRNGLMALVAAGRAIRVSEPIPQGGVRYCYRRPA